MPLTDAILNRAFAAIERAAIEGRRCPINQSMETPHGELRSGATTALARQGRVRFEIYAHNWRVAEILIGPHAGKRTMAPTNKSWKPYKTIEPGRAA